MKEQLGNPDEEDVADAHLLAAYHRHVITREYHGEDPDMFQDEWAKLMEDVGLDIAFKHFVDDDRNALNGADLAFFVVELIFYIEKTERADAARAGELLGKHGDQTR